MAKDFTGEIPQRIDAKGRVSVPADFRDALQQGDPAWTAGLPTTLVLQYADTQKDHLRGWSVASMDAARIKLGRIRDPDTKKAMRHFYFTQTSQLGVDKDGRTVLPQRFRERLGLSEGELTFLGYGDYFEIWKTETYHATKSAEIGSWIERQPEGIDTVSILDAVDAMPD